MEFEEKLPSGSLSSHPQNPFEEIEHTADRALKIYGRNLEDLLLNAAHGLNSLMAADDNFNPTPITKSIELDALDTESLLVEWLNELAYWAETEMLVFSEFNFQNVSPSRIQAKIYGNRVTQFENHIKAVTYHNLEIVKTKAGLAATVVFDV